MGRDRRGLCFVLFCFVLFCFVCFVLFVLLFKANRTSSETNVSFLIFVKSTCSQTFTYYRNINRFVFCNINPFCISLKTSLAQCVPNTGNAQCLALAQYRYLSKACPLAVLRKLWCSIPLMDKNNCALTVMFKLPLLSTTYINK